jgi:hypothetical protein
MDARGDQFWMLRFRQLRSHEDVAKLSTFRTNPIPLE